MRSAASLIAGALLASATYPQVVAAQQEPAVQPAPASDVPYAPLEKPLAATPIPQEAVAPAVAEPTPASPPSQDTAAAAPGGDKKVGEEIVITGSRIRRKDLTTAAPVTMLNREQIAASGKVSIGEFLQSIPEQGNATNTSVNNGGDGSTRISLRNLGVGRTLVLINGRRVVPGGTGADSSVDLNSIPTSAIERIEVLKDGASAVYGSDAIGGVVNIITRKRFQGAEATVYAGTSTHGDGSTLDVSVTGGTASEKGSIMFSAGYYKQQPVWADARNWSHPTVAFDATGENNPQRQGPGEYTIGDSNTVPAGTFSIPAKCTGTGTLCPGQVQPNPDNDPKLALYNQLVTQYPKATKFIRDPNAPLGWRPYVSTLLEADGGDALSVQPFNYLVTPQQRISLFSIGEYKLGESSRAYFEASLVNRQALIKLAPEPFTGGAYDFETVVSKDSIYNPFGIDIDTTGRRLVEFSNRVHDIEVNTARLVLGVDGTLPEAAGPVKGWFWDLSLNFGRTSANETDTGSLLLPNIAAAVGPSFIDPALGPQCGTPGNPIAGCVPLDLFGGPGTITGQMSKNLTYAGNAYGTNQMVALQANANGEIIRLPWADRAIALALGYEYRRLTGSFSPDPIAAAGYSTNSASSPTGGGYYVNEGYAELSLPIASHLPFVESLEATAAIRAFRYSTFGGDWTYKLGGRWSPFQDLTLRGTYSTAFRVPSISDLYSGQTDNFAPVSDPCADEDTAPTSCGTAAGNADDREQLKSKIGGNPLLKPETAKIYTAGLVIQPRWVKNLSITIDYYNVAVTNAITTIGEGVILAGCYPTEAGTAPKYCEFIERDQVTQQINKITNLQTNAGGENTSGVDIGIRYNLPTRSAGRFLFMFDGTWLKNFEIIQADGTVVAARGNYDLSSQGNGGQGGVIPAWKFNAGVLWGLGGFNAGANMRFIGSWHECGDAVGDFGGSGVCAFDSTYTRKVDAWTVWDATVGYTFKSTAGTTNIGVGVQNLFDTAPARVYNGFTSASDPTAYDFMGRFFYVRLSQNI